MNDVIRKNIRKLFILIYIDLYYYFLKDVIVMAVFKKGDKWYVSGII